MKPVSKPVGFTALTFSILSFAFFGVHVGLAKFDATHPRLLFAAGVPPVLMSLGAAVWGWKQLVRTRQADGNGLAIANAFFGSLGLLFWLVLVPLMAHFAVPAVQEDPEDPNVELSQQNMRVLIRHLKTFHQDRGRMAVKIDELVEKKYAPLHILYDPRDRLKDMPSYRIVSSLPSETNLWASTVALEGRWPDAKGRRLLGYWNETFGTTEPIP